MKLKPTRKFWIWVCSGVLILALVPVSVFFCWLYFPSLFNYNQDNVRTSSPLDPILASFEIEPSKLDVVEGKAKSYILRRLPACSTETQVLDFIKQNFTGGRQSSYSFSYGVVPESLRNLRYICIKAHEWGSAAGSSYVEIVFFLTSDRKLADVVIGEYDSYL